MKKSLKESSTLTPKSQGPTPHPRSAVQGRVMSHWQAGLWPQTAGFTPLLCLPLISLCLLTVSTWVELCSKRIKWDSTWHILNSQCYLCFSFRLLPSLSSANCLPLLFYTHGLCPPNLNVNSNRLPGISVTHTISWRKISHWASLGKWVKRVPWSSQLWLKDRTHCLGLTAGTYSFEMTQNFPNTFICTINIHSYKWKRVNALVVLFINSDDIKDTCEN